ncbi:hypothetical protein, partial [Bathycoccus sp. RCC716 virus 1]
PLHIECRDTSTHYENGLLVKQDSSSHPAVIGIRTSSTSQDPFISFMIDSNTTGWSYGVDASDSNKMKWAYNTSDLSASTKLTLTTSGYFGIGTTSPSYPLHVAGDINLTGSLRINGTAQTFGGGGGGSSSYDTADFNSYISTSSYDVEIQSSFTSSNYNYNSDKKYFNGYGFDYIDIRSSLPSSLWYEYHFRFDGYSNTIYDNFYVKINGSSKTTYVSLPNYSSSFSCSSSRVYEWVLKPIGSSANDWTAQLIEYR